MQRICQHCGKALKISKTFCYNYAHKVFYYDKEKGLTYEMVDLCPDCWASLFELRNKTDDKFYKECVYGK